MKLTKRLVNCSNCISLLSFVFLVFLLCCFFISKSQETVTELESQLPMMQEDTVKVNALIRLGKANCSMENDKALIFLQEAFTIATAKNYIEGIGQSLLWQGRVYYYKDDYPLAIKYHNMAIKYLEKANIPDDLAFNYFGRGEIERIRGDYISAIKSYTTALSLVEETGNLKLKASFYSSIGHVYLNRNEPQKALKYFKESLVQKQTINDLKGITNQLTSIGKAYEKLNQLDSSLWYHTRAVKIRRDLNINRAIAASEYNIGGILIKMEKYHEAENSLKIALDYFTGLEEKTGIIITNLRLATAQNYLKKENAIERAQSALDLAKTIKNPALISHAYQVLSEIYFVRADFKLAHDYLKEHNILDDSLFTTEKERMLTEFSEKYQSERKDREIEYYKAKSKLQKQNIILLIVVLIAAVGFAILLFYLFRIKSTALNRQKKLLEQEKIIHAQLNKITENENQILQDKLEAKNRELASKALEMIRLNDTITSIIEKMEVFKNSVNKNPELTAQMKEVINELETHSKQNIWNEFNKIFKNIHSDFYAKLLKICPDLSTTEIKTAALLKLNLTTKEIAAISFKSEGGVKTTRYRLRKKLGLSADEKLIPFLMKI